MTDKNMKPIWVGPKLHKIIKLEATEDDMTMQQLLAIMIQDYRKKKGK